MPLCPATDRGGTDGADDQTAELAGDITPEHAHDLPVAGRWAANAPVRGPHRVPMGAISHRTLLAAQPPSATGRLNRPRPAREEHRYDRRMSIF